MPTIIVTEGYVDKSEKGYLVESDFWGTVHSWDINEASFWSKDWKGCPPSTKVVRVTEIFEEHAPLVMEKGFKGKNVGKIQWVCPRCHKASNKNRDLEIGKAFLQTKPCSRTTIREYDW